MAQGELLPVIRSYVQQLKAAGIDVTGVVHHGPGAQGIELGIGDIELIVLSPAFGESRIEDGRAVLRAAWETDPRIVPTPMHPDGWAEADRTPRAHYAKLTGVEIPLD